MTNADIITYVRGLIDDPASSAQFISVADLQLHIDAVGLDFTQRTRAARTSSTVSVVAGTSTYSVASGCYEIIRMIDGNGYSIEPITLNELQSNWEQATGTPLYRLHALTGPTQFTLYPEPTDNDTFTYYFVQQHVAAAELSTSIPAQFHTGVAAGIASRALLKNTGESALLLRQSLLEAYENEVQKATLRAARNFVTKPAVIPYSNF